MPNDINFTEPDVSALTESIISSVESRAGVVLMPGDERRIFAEAMAYALGVFVQNVNAQCRARLLDYAAAYQLDALGARLNCHRLAPTPARVPLRFTLDTARPYAITIPAGTTVTADNVVLFTTDAAATIPAGEQTADVFATATVGGIITNGIPAGAIQSFVDRVPFVSAVINTAPSSGGSAGEPYPLAVDPQNGDDGSGDNRYRERIRSAAAGFSNAGGAASYEYAARSATAAVESVSVVSDQQAGTVQIYVTETGGQMPGVGTLAAVTAAVTDDRVRPLNDLVTVAAPTPVDYSIAITVYVLAANQSAAQKAIEGDGGALDAYIAEQQAVIGRDINPDRLRRALLEHCVRLEVSAPAYTAVSSSQIAHFNGSLNISYVTVAE